ncbi:hypothetical protein AB0Q99_34255, partial [Kitasatospora sp. NPDC086791]
QSVFFYCSNANITQSTTNTVTATYVPPGGTTPVTTPPSSATANVPSMTVLKEVCLSASAADCGQGGVGPWGPVTDVPSGGTAYWRITVTNTDGVDIPGVTLNDTVAPSCVTAAGTFTLPAGQSKQFFCSSSNLTQSTTNVVTASFVPPGSPPGTPPTTTPPSQATANVPSMTVKKEVCLSASAADCGQGGSGPWGPVTSVPSGGTAYWRITATNTDGVDIPGVTLNDTVAPSCVTAAGTFTLPAGQSKQFFCSSSNLTQSTTNVVTATFVPPGSPPGTPPTTTPPSQATANVPSMTVLKEVCLSNVAANCQAGGSGPWGPVTDVPSGGTAYWRITATNTDGVDIPGVTLNDTVAPSCVTAAGTFTLPAGQSKQFFCSSSNLTQSTTNVVTASFVPPGSPPGTPPTITPPSSATANVSTLVVKKEVCLSANAADCGQGGSGPWGPVTDVPSGGTAYWRITVTNTDGTAITGATLNDTVAPSCVTAAGTFNVPASQSVFFYCSNANITQSTTNTVTATYVPPGGTTPVTTPPSSATANVSTLVVLKEVCLSNVAANCQAGGSGPWGPVTDVPSGGT